MDLTSEVQDTVDSYNKDSQRKSKKTKRVVKKVQKKKKKSKRMVKGVEESFFLEESNTDVPLPEMSP